MTAIVIGNVRSLDESPGMAEYRRRVQGTMDPFQGRFLVRGGAVHVEEGDWHPVHLSVMEFPDEERVRAWLDSPAYQEILPLRAPMDLVVVSTPG